MGSAEAWARADSPETGDHRGRAPSPHQTTKRQLGHFLAPPPPRAPQPLARVGSARPQDTQAVYHPEVFLSQRAGTFFPEALPTLRFSGAPQEPPPLPQARGLPPSVLPVSGAHTQLPAGTQHQGSSCETSHMFRGTPALGALPPPCSHPPLLPQESSLLLSAPTSELAQKCFSRPT